MDFSLSGLSFTVVSKKWELVKGFWGHLHQKYCHWSCAITGWVYLVAWRERANKISVPGKVHKWRERRGATCNARPVSNHQGDDVTCSYEGEKFRWPNCSQEGWGTKRRVSCSAGKKLIQTVGEDVWIKVRNHLSAESQDAHMKAMSIQKSDPQ